MLKAERHQIILNEVQLHNRVLLGDIAEELNVSIDTVRRDVKELDEQHLLRKVHGGAIALGFNTLTIQGQGVYALVEKRKIAEKAIKLIRPGQVLLISGGTTNVELVRMLPPKLELTCFTPNLAVAVQLLNKPNVETILIGGKLVTDSQIAVGGSAINMLSDIRADLCFLGTNSIHSEAGITEFDWEIVQLKKAMISASKKVVSPSISEKLDSIRKYRICGTEAIDVLITELEPTDSKLSPYSEKNIEIL
ncbi:DeoR/GlpR family DNA-binding transcription regulator [Allomuricauda sp. d1]|uniref:DeoR/GlpR family DNA-binding transcription regulator n=1 Tax=Allomuricauda sp. d1 TaxID=3136725 RepID=UPI0031E42A3C